MKIIAAIIAICGVLQIASTEPSFFELRNDIILKEHIVWNVTRDLMENQVEITSPSMIEEQRPNFQANISSILEAAEEMIENATLAAVAIGKPAVPCLDSAKVSLEAINASASAQYDIDGQNITAYALQTLNRLDTALLEGQNVAHDLFSILPKCYNPILSKFKSCIADAAQNTTAQVESYKAAAENVLNFPDAVETFENVLVLLFTWSEAVDQAQIAARIRADEVKATAAQCIAAL